MTETVRPTRPVIVPGVLPAGLEKAWVYRPCGIDGFYISAIQQECKGSSLAAIGGGFPQIRGHQDRPDSVKRRVQFTFDSRRQNPWPANSILLCT